MTNLLKDALRVIDDHKRMPRYPVQEEVLQLLVERYRDNSDLDGVDLKVKTLNLFYSTGIRATNQLSEHIYRNRRKIDEALLAGDLKAVELIAKLELKGGSKRNNYSFATKYCALHQPDKYPIYDSIVAEVFLELLERGHLKDYPYSRNGQPNTYSRKSLGELMRKYPEYVKLYDSFMRQYGLEGLSYRKVDNYLWGAYKIADRNYEIERLAPIKKEIIRVKLTTQNNPS